MRAIENLRIVLPDGVIERGSVLFDRTLRFVGEVLPEGDYPKENGEGLTLTPGLIDLHLHGLMGKDFTDGSLEDNRQMAKKLAEFGVTGFLPTVMTVPRPQMERAMEALRPLVGAKGTGAAAVLGVHSEGPFLCHKRKGAQDPNGITGFDADWALRYADLLRLMAIAPEEPGAEAFICRMVRESRVVLSAGHSDATYEQMRRAVGLGLSHVTHLFNAMSPLNHREPGVAGAALSSPELSCELIADGFHVHPALMETVARAKGDKLCIITDSVRPAGLPDGEYSDASGYKMIKKGVACRLEDGTIAGSVLTMDQGLKNLMRFTSLPLHKAVFAATAAPADVLGERRIGRLVPGLDADLVLWDKNWTVKETILKGDTIYELQNL